MCGICGVASLEGPIDPAVGASVRAMADAMHHRGPDSDGFRESETAVLGFRRLAIIDRAGGDQPIGNEDGTCWIVFNGEIYNHHDLRAELVAKGHRFKTRSDTETILHGYEEHGPAVVDRLDGMFAFAIHDERTRTTFIARDRLGKKPLFYAVLGGILHFASELPPLRHSPQWDGTLELSALEGYLSLGYFLSPDSIFRAVHKLPPGHWLQLENGRIETRRYWDVTEFDTDGRDDAALVEAIDRELGQAVRARLESEVPLGAFLSGGIDSGLIVSYMAEALGDRLVTTSVGFDAGRAQRARRRAADGDALQRETLRRNDSTPPRRGARCRDNRVGGTAGRLLDDPDVVRVEVRTRARHGGAERRWRRRDVCRLRLPLRSARDRGAGTAARARRAGPAPGGLDRQRVAALAATATSAAARVAAAQHGA